ncbi:hypothetical protein [Kitasatospora sp. NPDC007106]|uniref:hypothetical protein n=1 Tax=Kitasatospora sp. NPDC007106 TaxID=3156914 RepID=UPI0033D6BFB9
MAGIETSLKEAMTIEGAIGAALGDYTSGMALGTAGPTETLSVAAAATTDILRAELRALGLAGQGDQKLEDILISLTGQYHLIRPLTRHPGLFLYLMLDRSRSNLAMARHQARRIEADLEL